MKAASIKEIKTELKNLGSQELMELCLKLSRFKKENKELMTYLIFEAADEKSYIQSVKDDIDLQFQEGINKKSFYLIKKGVRKILRNIKKFIRYSKKKETEVELLIYFCRKLKTMNPSISRNTVLTNIYKREMISIRKKLTALHEDLQYDYEMELEEIGSYKPS